MAVATAVGLWVKVASPIPYNSGSVVLIFTVTNLILSGSVRKTFIS